MDRPHDGPDNGQGNDGEQDKTKSAATNARTIPGAQARALRGR